MKYGFLVLIIILSIPFTVSGRATLNAWVFVREWPCPGQPTSISFSPIPDPMHSRYGEVGVVCCVDGSYVARFTRTGEKKYQWSSFGGGDHHLYNPEGLVVDGSDCVYVVDSGRDRLIRFFGFGELFNAPWAIFSGCDTLVLDNPGMIAKGKSGFGNLYVSDRGNNRIVHFHGELRPLLHWGGAGSLAGQFSNPNGVAVDLAENVYVADSGNNRIQKFDSTGNFLAQWGSFGTADGQFKNPVGVAVGRDGNVYVADTGNHRVQVFKSNGAFVAAWGDSGNSQGQFKNPKGIAVSTDSLIVFVADTGNNRIQVFKQPPISTETTTWGHLKNLYH